MPKRPYPKWSYRHAGIMRAMIKSPCPKNCDIAKATGYSPSQISRILSSPDFQAAWNSLWRIEMLKARMRFLKIGEIPPIPPDASLETLRKMAFP